MATKKRGAGARASNMIKTAKKAANASVRRADTYRANTETRQMANVWTLGAATRRSKDPEGDVKRNPELSAIHAEFKKIGRKRDMLASGAKSSMAAINKRTAAAKPIRPAGRNKKR